MTLSRQDTSIGFPPELESFRQLILSLDDKQWAAPSRCSGWTVADVAAHVVGTMADVANGQLEGLGLKRMPSYGDARDTKEVQIGDFLLNLRTLGRLVRQASTAPPS